MQQSIIEKVEAIREAVIGDRRSFHQYPELGWMEIRTAALVAEKLEVLGFELKIGREVLIAEDRMGLPKASELEAAYARALDQGASPLYIEGLKDGFTALIGILRCGEGPTIAMRFDMDALPVTEAHEPGHHPFDAGFASVNSGVMHACGHDGHTAMGLGVARVIASLKEHLKGTFKLIFQPAEEGVRGAKAMAHSGVLDDVDYLIGAHIGIEADSSGTLHTGMHGFYATSKMDIRFKGIPSHAGIHPEGGKNALLAAATASLQMHAIPRHSDGVTRINVGKLEAGSGRNVIPEDALMLVETRGGNSFLNNYMVDQVTHIVKHVAALYSVDYSIDTVGYAENASSDE
ncbi:MAG: amidohydrolase, partial [Clostridia bacterium]|nr:amidohydrolase [Clostridia bacterium]